MLPEVYNVGEFSRALDGFLKRVKTKTDLTINYVSSNTAYYIAMIFSFLFMAYVPRLDKFLINTCFKILMEEMKTSYPDIAKVIFSEPTAAVVKVKKVLEPIVVTLKFLSKVKPNFDKY